ncbi:hypothetical protein CBR_g47154 [Chara braunii]|uniref:SET domain-containing protein n=1 Tax=Chara braunii TaxID=69332 RepID=A0A388M1L9_CHABU|nr:hypothetical protein CBR_g47154 [Chara braunii]|eukprot:GBG88454.1 hypothetical protein CBR_g47154 [Chara braunii]
MVRVLLPLENDALFDKKQVLLTERCLSRVYDIADNEEQDDDELLNSMLRTSRILHLSETEIYFLENGDDGPTSPLNEIRAVSSLCEFLSKASAQFSQRRKRTRRELDGPVTSRACSSGNEECSCSGAVEASELIMSRNGGASRAFDILERLRIRLQDLLNGLGEAQMSALSSEVGVACKNWREVKLQEWATRQGVISKIHAAEYRSTGRGAAGRVDIEAGCVILEVPRSLLIYSDTVLHSELGQVFRMLESPFLEENDKAILWTIHERYNPDSFFEPFFAALPQTFCTGLSISEESLTLLDNTFLLAEIMQARELVRKRYNRLFPVLSATFAEVFPQDLFTWENFLWAAELWYLHEIKVHFPDGQVKACLIPVGSLFNHSLHRVDQLKVQDCYKCQ